MNYELKTDISTWILDDRQMTRFPEGNNINSPRVRRSRHPGMGMSKGKPARRIGDIKGEEDVPRGKNGE
jgi:hypothetical protein